MRSTDRRVNSGPRRGISLIEVLLSLAIFLLALVAIGRLVDFGSDRAQDAQLQTRGTRLALAKMAEVEAGVISVQSGGAGDFPEEPGWSWSVEPQPTGPPNVYQVTVRVTRDLNGKPFEVSLTQIVYDPALIGSAAQAEKTTTDSSSGGSGTTGGTGGTTGGMP